MIVVQTKEMNYTLVTTSDGNLYERYSPDSWFERMGESTEPIYNHERIKELENAFQLYFNQ